MRGTREVKSPAINISPPESEGPKRTAQYVVHLTNGETLQISSYDDIGDRYLFQLIKGGSFGCPKREIDRIEPIGASLKEE
jgi:hypothetical protein